MLLQVDDCYEVTVSPRFADAGVAIDWHEGSLTVWSRNHFMACNSTDIDRKGLLAGGGIDEAKVVVALIHYQQGRITARRKSLSSRREYKEGRCSKDGKTRVSAHGRKA